jgi:hypothetical protein
MRSDLIFVALGCEKNRYKLVRLIANATRKLHRPHTRIPDTMNDALALFGTPTLEPSAKVLKPVPSGLRRAA